MATIRGGFSISENTHDFGSRGDIRLYIEEFVGAQPGFKSE